MVALKHDITQNGVWQQDLVLFMQNAVTLCNELKVQHTALLADVTTLRTAFNTAMTKLNADAGVTDTNYAADAALTAVALTSASLTLSKG